MILDQHKEQFADAIRLASETLGISPIYVEKDYWITKMLRRLSESNLATHIVWKGGTSLSKGYGIIDRFSSDIDVAVIAGEMSGNKIKNLLSTATELMTEEMNEVDMPGETSKGSRYRKTYHRYKSVIAMGNEKSLVGDHVIVEINSFATPYPYEQRPVSSFIAQALQIKGHSQLIDSFGLQPFEINILDLRRTLCEKVASLLRFSFGDNPAMELGKKIRHFYDLHFLSQDNACQEYLATDFLSELQELVLHDKETFSTPAKWPNADISTSPLLTAFDPLWASLNKRYEEELEMLAFRPIPPSDQIRQSVKQIMRLIIA